ncbi:hypothetical protein ACIA49_39215 [Kribbella sp. NPDC051587]|uniref:hypothetical protein n=1 Tax=Kribbella sp. NPDC051587 TaxID=3364119 RepID=UPI0037B0EC00
MDPAAGPTASRTPDPGERNDPAPEPVESKTADKFAYVFYGVAATAALVGQVWAGVKHIPWPETGFNTFLKILLVTPAVAVIELGGVATSGLADVRRRKGENAYAYRAMSLAAALVALAFNVIGHWSPGERFLAFGFGGLSAFAYVLWIVHSGARRRDALRATGRMAQTAPVYGPVRWLTHPRATWRARQLALEFDLGLFESVRRAETELRIEDRNKNISTVVSRIIKKQHKDTLHADIAVAAYDSAAIAAEVAGDADNGRMARHIGRVIEPPPEAADPSTDETPVEEQPPGQEPAAAGRRLLTDPNGHQYLEAANHWELAVSKPTPTEFQIADWIMDVQREDMSGHHVRLPVPPQSSLSGRQPAAGQPDAANEVADTVTEAATAPMSVLDGANAQIASVKATPPDLANGPHPDPTGPAALTGQVTGQHPVMTGTDPDDEPEPPDGPGRGTQTGTAAIPPGESGAEGHPSPAQWSQPAPAHAGATSQASAVPLDNPVQAAPQPSGLADTMTEPGGHATGAATRPPAGPDAAPAGRTESEPPLTPPADPGQEPAGKRGGRRGEWWDIAQPAMDAWADAGEEVTAPRLAEKLGMNDRTARRLFKQWKEERAEQQRRENGGNVVRLTGHRNT